MERLRRATNNSSQDEYVLKVFLPLLAIAILACIGGCCYMERRRRRRKRKNGGVDPEELRQQQNFDDAASIISTSSSKRRHYLDPTPTTGRLVRGSAVRSNYSSMGEPLYEAQKRRRSSVRSRNDFSELDGFGRQQPESYNGRKEIPSSRYGNNGYGGRPLSRARSMIDMRYEGDEGENSLRRTRSSNNFGTLSSDVTDSGYQENQSNSENENPYEFLRPKSVKGNSFRGARKRASSPTRSEYSVRTAPSRTGRDDYQTQPRPYSVRSNYTDRRIPMMRSLSQPDLSRIDSKTYPQGILKKDNTFEHEQRQSAAHGYRNNIQDANDNSDYRGYYGQRNLVTAQHHFQNSNNEDQNARPSSRPSSVLSYGRTQTYDPYYSRQYGDYQGYGSYSQPPAYSSSGYQRHHQLPGKYQYGGYNDYWSGYTNNHNRMSMY